LQGAWAGEMAFLKQFWEKEQRSVKKKSVEKGANTGTNNKEATTIDRDVKVKTIPTGGGLCDAYIYSIIATEDCTVMSWSHEEMEGLMKSSTDLRSALTRAMSSALVGKVINLTVSRTNNKIPWLEWLQEWKSKDGTSVKAAFSEEKAAFSEEIQSDFRLAEDRP